MTRSPRLPSRRMTVSSSAGPLEALLRAVPVLRGGALVCHPHPLYGGTMQNRVVVAAERGFLRAGLSVLRFNFRGAGHSAGRHDGGRGERDDVQAALEALAALVPNGPLVVGGYSFGCTVGLPVGAAHPRVEGLLGIGVSFRVLPAPELPRFGGVKLFVQGDRDELGPLTEIRPWLDSLPGATELRVVEGADHFFAGSLVTAVEDAAASLGSRVGGAPPAAPGRS